MTTTWIWLGFAVLALVGEVLTGTLYLLSIALGFAFAGVAAAVGWSQGSQLGVCALTILVGVLLLRGLAKGRLGRRETGHSPSTDDSNLDLGQTVDVTYWNEQGGTRVWYRGAHWEGIAEATYAIPHPGIHKIVAVQGNRLVLQAQPSIR